MTQGQEDHKCQQLYAPSLLNIMLRKAVPMKKQLFASRDLRSEVIQISGLREIQLKAKIKSLTPGSGIAMKLRQALLL